MKSFLVEQAGNIPYKRCGHKSVIYKNNLYLFGGNTDSESNKSLLFKFNIYTNSWSIINTLNQNSPYKRTSHTCIVYKNHLYVFGGVQDFGQNLDFEILKYSFESKKWDNISSDLDETTDGRFGHTTILYKNKAIVFGGYSVIDSLECIEILEFNLDDIKDCSSYTANQILKISFHTSDLKKNTDKIYHFGGTFNEIHSNNLFEYQIEKSIWKMIKPKSDIKPIPRRSHGSSMDNQDNLFIFGGFSGENFLNDLWKFNFETMEWKEVKYDGEVPKRRYFSISNYENGFYVFGGVNDSIIDQKGDEKLVLMNDLIRFEWESSEKNMIQAIYKNFKNNIYSDVFFKINE